MNVIKVSGTTATIEEANVLSWSLSTVVNPFTGQPTTSAQTLAFAGLIGIGSAIGGYMLRGSKHAEKINRIAGIDNQDGFVS